MEITLPYFQDGVQNIGSGTSDSGIGFEVDMPTSLRNIFGLDSSTTYRFVNTTGSAGQPATATHRLTIPINITSNGTDDAIYDALTDYDKSTEVDTKLANYDTSTGVDDKISTALTSYDTSGEVDTKIANASSGGGGGGSWEEGTGGDIYYTGGDVSIGATTPGAKLTVIGSGNANISAGNRRFFNASQYVSQGKVMINYNDGNWNFASIYADGDITTGGFLAAVGGTLGASDERIKKEIVDVEDGSALETLRLLKPKKYKYVDEVQRGSEPVWGFIAQQVRETLPFATQLRTECLPNIYELANVSNSNVITFSNFDTSNLESNAMVLKVYDVTDTEHLVNITEVIDEHSIRVDINLSDWTEDDKIFVYGQQVKDFVFLKKEAIFTVATSALQEVDRQLQSEKTKVASLEARLSALEEKI